ncbi:DUF86 domain-containing protein [Planococcaceae bacterium Storch 2/2-2]|nr:DUF86 domain-containing protein [Planococcaceae bacterium Storch 2/2-2]
MYFVDRNEISTTLDYMNYVLHIFEQESDWLGSDMNKLALDRLVHVTIESIIDVGNSMIDGFIMRDPGSYEDIIDIMDDEEVITDEMVAPLKEVVALRDMIVRHFKKVDYEVVLDTMERHIDVLKQWAPAVNDYLENELGPVSAFLPEDEA